MIYDAGCPSASIAVMHRSHQSAVDLNWYAMNRSTNSTNTEITKRPIHPIAPAG